MLLFGCFEENIVGKSARLHGSVGQGVDTLTVALVIADAAVIFGAVVIAQHAMSLDQICTVPDTASGCTIRVEISALSAGAVFTPAANVLVTVGFAGEGTADANIVFPFAFLDVAVGIS